MQRADAISPETMKEKPMIRLPLFALTLVAGALPAAAQDIAGPAANEKVNQIIVYGEDRCEPSSRSEEHTSELQSLMRIQYAVFCLKKKQNTTTDSNTTYRQQY